MEDLIIGHGLSQRRACRLLIFDRSVGRYKRKARNDADLRGRIISIAHERKRFGYRRIHIMSSKTRDQSEP